MGNLDDDLRDEVNGGYFVLDHDGKPLWEKALGRNMDSVAIAEWDNGQRRAFCSGYGQVMSANGEVVLALGQQQVPHGQELRVANFLADHAGPEMVIRHQGHRRDILLVSSSRPGRPLIKQLKLNESPNNVGLEAVYWQGREQAALLFNGGGLWDLQTGRGSRLSKLPPAGGKPRHRMGFYHAIPANICGDDREELVVWDPTARHIMGSSG